MYHEWDSKTPGLKSLEIEGLSDIGRDVLPTPVFMRIPTRVCSLFLPIHKLVIY